MFGMGGSEIIVILIVALLFLGPDKLPQAAKSISKGIRDIKKQSRALQQQIESDEQIGGAIRDLKSALRGEEAPIRPKPYTPHPPAQLTEAADAAAASAGAAVAASADGGTAADPAAAASAGDAAASPVAASGPDAPANGAGPALRLPPTAGQPDPSDSSEGSAGDDDLAAMIKPAPGTIAKGS